MNYVKKISCMLVSIVYVQIAMCDDDGATGLKKAWDSIKNSPQSIWTGVQGMVGYLDPDTYYYNFWVWNDSPGQVLIGVQGMINIEGIKAPGDYHTLHGIPFDKDFHNYILCPPFFNTGDCSKTEEGSTCGEKTPLVMKLYISLFQDALGTMYPASFQEFDAALKARRERDKKYVSVLDSLITKDTIEMPLEIKLNNITNLAKSFQRNLQAQYKNDQFAQQLFNATNQTTFEKNQLYERDLSEAQIEKDTALYFYRAYRDTKSVKAEYIQGGGSIDTPAQTVEFAGTFYVSSQQKDLFLTFNKDDKTYTVALESGSFNTLQSTPQPPVKENAESSGSSPISRMRTDNNQEKTEFESIRPSFEHQFTQKFGFQFYQGDPAKTARKIAYVPITSIGPAYAYDARTADEVKKNDPIKYAVGPARPYTYELYDTNGTIGLACHSLRIGQAPLPSTPDKREIRDINPIACKVWVQSADFVMQSIEKARAAFVGPLKPIDYSEIPYDAGRQLWVGYYTKDSVVIQKLVDGVNSFIVLRPRISEKFARLYICSLDTSDEKKAQQFMQRVASGAIGLPATHQEVSDIKKIDIPQTVAQMQPNTFGIIVDTKGDGATGISGALLVTDAFTPSGLGNGDRYYYVYPPQLNISILAGMLPLEKDPDLAAFSQQVVAWIAAYKKQGKQAVADQLTTYIRQFGIKELFVDGKKDAGKLTEQAQKIIENYLTGKVSLQYPPIIYQAGMSYVILGEQPKNWPAATTKPAK